MHKDDKKYEGAMAALMDEEVEADGESMEEVGEKESGGGDPTALVASIRAKLDELERKLAG